MSTRATTPSPLESADQLATHPAQVHLHLEGHIDFVRLQAAWQNIVERKEELSRGLSPNGNSHKYKQGRYHGNVALMRSQQRTSGFGRVLHLGRGELLGKNLEIYETPGNHCTIYMHPNGDALAHRINVSLRKAEERLTHASAIRFSG